LSELLRLEGADRVKRDRELLRAALASLTDDLVRSFGPDWSCSLVPGPAVRVTDGHGLELLEPVELEFDPEDALAPGALDSVWRDQSLADDATDTVAEAVQEALLTGQRGPGTGAI
jgi:hypothetical protein